jgi:drug/metabolite transporter (DMT)-like permease
LDQFATFGLPFIAAVLYVFAALSLKRAGEKGADIWLVAFVTNLICGLFFASLFVFPGTLHAELLWQPFVTALLFFAGQFLAFLSFHRGDVSIATPVLSLKIIMVAFFSVLLLNSAIGWMLWAASVLAALGVTLLSRSSGSGSGAKFNVAYTLLTAGLAALAFAVFDVLVMKWSPHWGLGVFLPVMMAFVALMSFGFIPLFKKPVRDVSPDAWRWLWGGGALMSLQSLLFVGAIAYTGRGTVSNIIYATRGLWSVLAVWLLGHWFQSQEIKSGESKTLVLRLFSALLIISAVVLALLSK